MATKRVGEASHEEKKAEQARFSKELLSGSKADELRSKHLAGNLSAKESMELILAGNSAHMKKLAELGVSPNARTIQIKEGKADYLVVACSDARLLQLDSEEDRLVGVQIRVAGNVIPRKGTPSFDEIKEAVEKVKEDGLIIIEGHIHCGAVKEKVKWMEGGSKPTGSAPLDSLLHEVFGSNPSENAMGQLTKVREQIGLINRASGAVVYDWEHGDFEILGANHSPVLEILVGNWKRMHSAQSEEADLAQALKKQKPHAIVVAEVGMPFSVMTIAHAKQNEVFSTSGSEKGLDAMDEASILYAVEHLGVRHIPFIAGGTKQDEPRINRMFYKWEKDLCDMSVGGAHLLAQMIDTGKLTISRLRYDLERGEIVAL